MIRYCIPSFYNLVLKNKDMEDNTPKPKPKDRLTLYKEYRLIERNEAEISGSWKGIL